MILTHYSIWYLIPILLISFAVATLLYHYSKGAKTYTFKQRILLFSLRFLAIFLAFSLFLMPSIKVQDQEIQKPIILIAQDNSSSILMSKDSTFYKTKFLNEIEETFKDLESDYEIKYLKFGNQAKEISKTKEIDFKDNTTDMSELLQMVNDNYSNLNLSTLIICSDGILNKGKSPLNQIQDFSYPIFTVAMGDATVKKDISISEIRYNRIAYLNNKFPLEIVVLAQKAKGSNSVLRVMKEGKTLFEEKFSIDNETYSKQFNTILNADKVGIQRYTISVQTIDNEQTTTNNTRDIFVEVLDGRQKVLLLANSPSPDISAIKQAIENNENYEVESLLFNKFNPKSSLKEYNIAILHQIPSNNPEHIKLIENLRKENIPILYIIGGQTEMPYFNKVQKGLQISQTKTTLNQVTPILNTNFTLFSISSQTQDIINQFPPLQSPFGKYNLSANLQSLMFQKAGTISTDYPMICFSNSNSERIGVIVGEGFWRWRMQNYLINQTHSEADEIIHKSIQYLASRVNKSRFRVICNNVFAENEPILMDAELYNESYELVNTPEVKLTITDSKGTKYPFIFSKTINSYHLNAGVFPSGKYTYNASSQFGGSTFTASGVFYVSTQNLEAINLVADHNLLYNISNQTDAKMIYPNQIKQLKDLIKERKDIKPLITQTITNKNLIDQWWYLALIVLFFAAEWFLRKYWGSI